MGNPIVIGLLVVGVILMLFIIAYFAQFLSLYIRATASGSHISLLDLVGMRIRKVNALAIVNARIQAQPRGDQCRSREMESHVLAGGDVQRVINAMIAANKARSSFPGRSPPRSTWPAATSSMRCRPA